jgi:hypothetical protein
MEAVSRGTPWLEPNKPGDSRAETGLYSFPARDRLGLRSFGITINLVTRGPQAVHAMPVHIAFPS